MNCRVAFFISFLLLFILPPVRSHSVGKRKAAPLFHLLFSNRRRHRRPRGQKLREPRPQYYITYENQLDNENKKPPSHPPHPVKSPESFHLDQSYPDSPYNGPNHIPQKNNNFDFEPPGWFEADEYGNPYGEGHFDFEGFGPFDEEDYKDQNHNYEDPSNHISPPQPPPPYTFPPYSGPHPGSDPPHHSGPEPHHHSDPEPHHSGRPDPPHHSGPEPHHSDSPNPPHHSGPGPHHSDDPDPPHSAPDPHHPDSPHPPHYELNPHHSGGAYPHHSGGPHPPSPDSFSPHSGAHLPSPGPYSPHSDSNPPHPAPYPPHSSPHPPPLGPGHNHPNEINHVHFHLIKPPLISHHEILEKPVRFPENYDNNKIVSFDLSHEAGPPQKHIAEILEETIFYGEYPVKEIVITKDRVPPILLPAGVKGLDPNTLDFIKEKLKEYT